MHKLAAMAIAGILALPLPAAAQGVEVTNTALIEVKTVDQDGKEEVKYLAADKVTPGDTIMYLITFTNRGDKSAEGIVLTSEIPSDLIIKEGSAEAAGARVEYSIDNGKTYADREALVVTTSDGGRRPATAEDLTNLRWTILDPLPAGGINSVSYRAVVK